MMAQPAHLTFCLFRCSCTWLPWSLTTRSLGWHSISCPCIGRFWRCLCCVSGSCTFFDRCRPCHYLTESGCRITFESIHKILDFFNLSFRQRFGLLEMRLTIRPFSCPKVFRLILDSTHGLQTRYRLRLGLTKLIPGFLYLSLNLLNPLTFRFHNLIDFCKEPCGFGLYGLQGRADILLKHRDS